MELRLKYYKTTDIEIFDLRRVNEIIDIHHQDLKLAKENKDMQAYEDISNLIKELKRIRKYKEFTSSKNK